MPEKFTIDAKAAVEMLTNSTDWHAFNFLNQMLVKICAIIEEFMSRGDRTVREAVATGMLESMLGESSAGRFDASILVPFSGTETKANYRAWGLFTGVQTPGFSD